MKEVLLNLEEVFRLIGRQSWEIERLRAKIEELSQALSAARKEPSGKTTKMPVKEKSATEGNRDAIKGCLVMQGKSLSAWARENGYTNGVVGKVVERFAGNERRPRSGSKSQALSTGRGYKATAEWYDNWKKIDPFENQSPASPSSSG